MTLSSSTLSYISFPPAKFSMTSSLIPPLVPFLRDVRIQWASQVQVLEQLSSHSPKPPFGETAEGDSEWVGVGNVATSYLQLTLSDIKQEKCKERNTLDFSILTVALTLILMFPWHNMLNSKMLPTRNFPFYSPKLWIWWDIMLTIVSLYMGKKCSLQCNQGN